MTPQPFPHALLLAILFLHPLPLLQAQTSPSTTPSSPQGGGAGASVVNGPKGFLSIDYRGGRFVLPFRAIVSLSRHEFLVDGGGKVHELTVDTIGGVIARYYFLESPLENVPLNAAQIVNNRLKRVGELAEDRTGQDARTVVKHYPDTTHAKTVEFNVSSTDHLERIYAHIYDDWVTQNGRGDGRTLQIR